MSEDPLIDYINKKTKYCELALTDRSYRVKYQKDTREENKGKPNVTRNNDPIPINFELGTLGDAVLRLILTNILYHDDKIVEITEERKKYESDEVLVTVIAAHYDIRKHLHYDDKDENKCHGYDYWEHKGNGDHPQKFLATAIEALLGAYYLDNNESLKDVEPVVRRWMGIIDEKRIE